MVKLDMLTSGQYRPMFNIIITASDHAWKTMQVAHGRQCRLHMEDNAGCTIIQNIIIKLLELLGSRFSTELRHKVTAE